MHPNVIYAFLIFSFAVFSLTLTTAINESKVATQYRHVLFEIVDLKKDSLIEITFERPGIPGLIVKNIPKKRCPMWQQIELGTEWYLLVSEDFTYIDLQPICQLVTMD